MENLENRFKIYACELSALDIENDGESDVEKARVLRENIDFVLDRALQIGEVRRIPLEPRVYHMTFPGHQNGEIRPLSGNWKV